MMGSVCAEQQHHKFHHSHQQQQQQQQQQLYHHHHLSKKPLRDIDIPPRKLLGRRAAAATDFLVDSPKSAADEHAAVFSKFLPYNNADSDSDSDDPYSSDHFRMFEFKVRKCNRSRSHDWTDCPFAHPGEKARRRDPRRFHYTGTVCSEFRKGHCSKGDNCDFSHGVFECWLHPSRYRTEACKDGKNCKRKVCFFAHSTRQLRIVPENPPSPPPPEKYLNRCCVFCHHSMSANSPTSTLMGMAHASPPASPPGMSYKEALAELMANFEAMNMAEANRGLPWLDDEQPQFVLSPSTPTFSRGGRLFHGRNLMEEMSRYNVNGEGNSGGPSGPGGPDLGWVNDLLT